MNIVNRVRLSLAIVWLCLQAGSFSGQAATNIAASVAYNDVVAAVAAASPGDVVLIPPGTVTWTNTLTIAKSIRLHGSGTNATFITRTNEAIFKVKLDKTAPIRLTGMTLIGGWSYPIVRLHGSGVSDGGAVITSFRVDHCLFTSGCRAVNPRGWCYGVVDHCVFLNCNIGVGVSGDNDAAWARPIEPGSTNAVYIEDNKFIVDNNAPASPNEQVYHQEGARSVTRYNTFDGTKATLRDTVLYDSHGNWSVNKTNSSTWLAYRGQPVLEIYGNTLSVHHTFQFFHIRGGSVLVFSNALSYLSGGKPHNFRMTEEEGWQTSLFLPLRTNWPALDQHINSFFWGNTANGAAITNLTFTYPTGSDAIFIQQNRDYWMQPPSESNGRPIGAYSAYSPLRYPHPLISADDLQWLANPHIVAGTP